MRTIQQIEKELAALKAEALAKKEELLRKQSEITATIAKLDVMLSDHSTHDCTQNGTRRVYKFRNVTDAIKELLSRNPDEVMTTGEIHRELNADGLSYAYSTVATALCRLNAIDDPDVLCLSYGYTFTRK